MRFRSYLWAMLVLLLAIGFCGCVSKDKTEIQPEEAIEVESEEEETETKPVVIEIESKFDKHALMYKLWPEWDQYTYASNLFPENLNKYWDMNGIIKGTYYPVDKDHGHVMTSTMGTRIDTSHRFIESLDCVMYASKDQLVYGNITSTDFMPLQEPYYGQVVGALEKGEAVHVLCSFFLPYRPYDGIFYVIGDGEGNPFLDAYVGLQPGFGGYGYGMIGVVPVAGQSENGKFTLTIGDISYSYDAKTVGIVKALSMTPPVDGHNEEVVYDGPEVDKKSWMSDIWPEWEEYKVCEENQYFYVTGKEDPMYRHMQDVFPQKFYPEEDYWEIFYPERYEEAVMVQKEKTDVIMYATERQLVYAEIMPTVKGPLKDPYYGPVVGALEKGEPVRVVSVIENQQRPEDGEYYGIAIDLEIGSTPFLSEYMDPFVERFGADAFGSNSAAYGYAVKLSSTPPSE